MDNKREENNKRRFQISRIICGCSFVVERIQDGQDLNLAGDCEICCKSGGRYDRSPHFKELMPQLDTQAVEDKFNPPPKKGKK